MKRVLSFASMALVALTGISQVFADAPGVMCELSGAAGQTVACSVRVARASGSTPAPASLQFSLSYPDQAVFQGLADCNGCPTLPLPGTPAGTNWLVSASPASASAWAGTGSVVVLSTDASPLTSVSLLAGVPQGDPELLVAYFQLAAAVPAATPLEVVLRSAVAGTTSAAPLNVVAANGILVVSSAPSCAGNGLPCNDSNACTTGDTCVAGACSGQPVVCTDGNACNGVETCNPASGCVAGAPQACNDGSACTSETCAPASGCVVTAINCNDNEPCTVDSCNPASGCVHTIVSTQCDDGEPCTQDACQPGVGCTHTPTFCFNPNQPPNVLCQLSGALNSTATCSIRVARSSQTGAEPATALIDLRYGADLKLLHFRECTACPIIPPAVALSTGHSVVANPTALTAWNGAGKVSLLNLSLPDTSLTPAYLNAGLPVGDSEVIQAVFQIQGTAGTTNRWVWADLDGSSFAGAGAVPLSAAVASNHIVLSDFATPCGQSGAACNDGNPCTDNDTCLAGKCVGTPRDCSDGNFCNGLEVCNGAGNCVAGPAANCEDGNLCTINACNPTSGCTVVGPVDCSDGNPCTADTCVPASGCSSSAAGVSCDDNDPCTADACNPAFGCEYTPLFCYGDGPTPNAVCSLSGAANAEVWCTLRVARRTNSEPNVTAFQAEIQYPSTLTLLGFYESQGSTVLTPPALFTSGHSVLIAPNAVGGWSGTGQALVLNQSSPSAVLSQAFLQGGVIQGDAVVLAAKFRLNSTVTAGNPAVVSLPTFSVGGPDALSFTASLEQGVIVVDASDVTCNTPGAACNDGNACTQNDVCTAGICVGTPVNCNDGNHCNGIERCDAALGCVSGLPTNCAQGNACDVESCNPATGCFAAGPLNCDDNDICTVDSCNPATGCAYAPADAAVVCNDGDACTADTCAADTCSHAPTVCYVPSPPAGGLCWLSGAAGSTVECKLGLARLNAGGLAPTTMQLGLDFPSHVQLVGINFGTGAGTLLTPPPAVSGMPTGHAFYLSPTDAATWSGTGTVAALHLSNPTTALSGAFLTDGDPLNGLDLSGPAHVVTLVLELSQAIDADAPELLTLQSAVITAAGALPLSYTVEHGVDKSAPVIVVSGGAPCAVPGAPCNDGNACTTGDTCIAGACVGAALDCSDGSFCNGEDLCNPASGCVSSAAPTCDDGDACTVDACDDMFGCTVTGATNCDDNNGCTTDSCNPATGCVNAVPPGTCDDGDACTGDSCSASLGCVHAPLFCYEPTLDGALCVLSGGAGATVACPVRVVKATSGTADPSALQLAFTYQASAATFLGFTACNGCTDPVPPAALASGHLVSIAPASPAAFNGAGTFVITPSPSAPNAALSTAFLSGGSVQGSAEVMWAWFQLAQAQTSLPILGGAGYATQEGGLPLQVTVDNALVIVSEFAGCATSGAACDDGNACTTGDVCVAGSCIGTAVQCTDGDFCNGIEFCNPNTGACVAGPLPDCDDGNSCTTDSCTQVGCASAPVTCDDGNACTTDSCNPASGCVFAAVSCDDGDPCTADSCNPGSGCAQQPLACFELATDVICRLSGSANQVVDCPVRLVRADQAEDPATALQVDLLWAPSMVDLLELRRADGSPLGLNNTIASGHALFPNNETAGKSTILAVHSTAPDTAINGAYLPGPTGNDGFFVARFRLAFAFSPSDPLPIKAAGIFATASGASVLVASVVDERIVTGEPDACPVSGAPCDDGNACTTGDTCLANACIGAPVVCGDGNACTGLDTCNPLTGCSSTLPPNCNDNNDCTNDVCDPAIGCVNLTGIVCDDGNECTDDFCQPNGGCTNIPNNGTCDDGVACSLGGVCVGTTCVSLGGQLDCDDGNVCTTDSCVANQGCAHTPVACDDGVPCTLDFCDPVLGCRATPQDEACADSNTCTTEYCHPLVGCVFAYVAGTCTDGNACTLGDTCVNGQCVGTSDPNLGQPCDGGDGDFCEDGVVRCIDAQTGVACVNTGPILLWEFDGNVDTVAVDVSGNDRNGSLLGDASVTSGGVFGSSLRTFGVSGRLRTMMDFPERNFTITMWFRTGSLNGTLFTTAAGSDTASGGSDRTIFIRNGRLGFTMATASGTVGCSGQGPLVNTSTWRPTALVCDAAVGCTLYTLVGTSMSPICTTSAAQSVSSFVAQDRVLLGYGPLDGYYNGSFDRVSAYEVALTQAQLNSAFETGVQTALQGQNLELCDAEDNDCNGTIDDLCACLFAGDLNSDGNTDVIDAQCSVLVSLATLVNGLAPGCLVGPTTVADLDCNGTVNVVDVQLVIRIALNLPLVPDVNANQCVDTCEPDL